MKLELQICSLELAKRLKELGVKQESYFKWYLIENNEWVIGHPLKEWKQISAFSVAELGEMLPIDHVSIKCKGVLRNDLEEKLYWVCFNNFDGMDSKSIQKESNEANARAKMIIYLIENGYK